MVIDQPPHVDLFPTIQGRSNASLQVFWSPSIYGISGSLISLVACAIHDLSHITVVKTDECLAKVLLNGNRECLGCWGINNDQAVPRRTKRAATKSSTATNRINNNQIVHWWSMMIKWWSITKSSTATTRRDSTTSLPFGERLLGAAPGIPSKPGQRARYGSQTTRQNQIQRNRWRSMMAIVGSPQCL